MVIISQVDCFSLDLNSDITTHLRSLHSKRQILQQRLDEFTFIVTFLCLGTKYGNTKSLNHCNIH